MAVLVIVDKKGLGNLSKAINVALCGIIWSPVVSGKRKQEGFEGSGAHDFPERPNFVQRLHVCPQRPTATISLKGSSNKKISIAFHILESNGMLYLSVARFGYSRLKKKNLSKLLM